MKKYIILTAVTLILIVAVLSAGMLSEASVAEVSCRTLQHQEARQTVICTGHVETADSVSVNLSQLCFADTVYVKVGQKVTVGEPLFSVDTEGTAAALTDHQISEEQRQPISSEVLCPVSGVISALNVRRGTVADTDEPCAVISGADILQVRIYVPEKSIRHLQIGQAVNVSGVGFREQEYPGRLIYIAPNATQQINGTSTQTVVEAIVLLDERYADRSLRLGLTASAEIITQTEPDVLIAPYDCVVEEPDGTRYVYVAENGVATRRVLTVGREWSDGYEVLSGISAGERLITAPESITHNGMPVADVSH